MAERARLTLDMDPALHRKLKVRAAREGKTMREVCLQAIERQLQDELAPEFLTRANAPLLVELWDNDADKIYDDEEI